MLFIGTSCCTKKETQDLGLYNYFFTQSLPNQSACASWGSFAKVRLNESKAFETHFYSMISD
ncbi:MAG: hypothetical protein IKT62_03570, partial [Firmicutes bacterium]|nr:hypothetical protein [Bacillota bacterium]